MKLIYVMLPALCVLSGTIRASETPLASAEAPVEVFEGPSSVEKPPAPFPMSERKRLTGENAARPAFAQTFTDRIKAVDADELVGQPGTQFRLTQL